MHIVYISQEFPPSQRAGGIASYVKEIADGMIRLGHQVTIVTASDDTRISSDTVEDGIRVLRLSGGAFFVPSAEGGSKMKKLRIIYRFHSYRRKVMKTIKKLKDIDIIEVADYGAEGLYLEKINVPIILRLHTPSLFHRGKGRRGSVAKREVCVVMLPVLVGLDERECQFQPLPTHCDKKPYSIFL